MMEHINFQNIIDIGFIVLVTVACARSLFGRSSQSEGSGSQAWKDELSAVEKTLQGLIAEAGAASTNLDRNLLQRKRELESLLKKLEKQNPVMEPPSERRGPTEYTPLRQENSVAADLPNETWLRSERGVQASSPYQQQTIELKESLLQQRPALNSLEQIASAASDTVKLSQQLLLSRQQPYATAQQPLASEIEISASEASENETYSMLNIMDPTTYRIARRLLKEGHEIHVVARKVDLPVSEIRMLDKLMRRETKIPLEEPVKHLVRSHEGSAEATLPEGLLLQPQTPKPPQADLDQAIERELALL